MENFCVPPLTNTSVIVIQTTHLERIMISLRKSPLLLLASLLISINAFAQDRPVADSSAGEPPKVGLRVIEVLPGSPAAAAGLQTMDTISKYGDFAVVDAASYFVAR